MYPDLSYIFHALFGTPPDNALSVIKTFGLFLILSFLASAYFLRLELKRKEEEGLIHGQKERFTIGRPATPLEMIGNGVLGFVLGFKLPYIIRHFDEFKGDTAGVLLSGQGDLLLGIVGAIALAGLKFWEMHRKRLDTPVTKEITIMPHQRIGDITILAAVSGIVGAKLAAVFESTANIRDFIENPLAQLLSGSGLAIYGGLILAFVAVYWYVGKKGIKPIHVMDAVAPALIIGYGVGRIGCQLSGDGDWGIVNTLAQPSWWFLPDSWWAYDYPHNVLEQGVAIQDCTWVYCNRLSEPVFPTPVYETIMAFIIAGILWALRKRIKIPGMLFFIYLILMAIERFFIERIRVNPDLEIFGIAATQAEFISLLLVVVGIAGMFWTWRRGK